MRQNWLGLKGNIVASGHTIKDISRKLDVDYQKLQKQLNGELDIDEDTVESIESLCKIGNVK